MWLSWMHRHRAATVEPGAESSPSASPSVDVEGGEGPDAGPSGKERRRHARYPAVVDLARVRWRHDEATSDEPACLVDISRGGARLVAAIPLPGGADLLIGLVEPGDLPEVEASIVRVSECRGVGYLVQVKFLQPCPDDVFERATGGSEAHAMAFPEEDIP